jgi:hypothetical protein
MVDLRDQQTPIRNQGGRGTCQVHAVCAAMEAALKRAGYGNVDLSEDTFTYFGKLFWLAGIEGKPADTTENQIGGSGGGNGVECLRYLAGDLAIPEEFAGHPDGYDYAFSPDWNDDYWASQFNMDSWNLSPRHLLPATLLAPRYFTVTSFQTLNATSAEAIETALRGGHEVIWDFACSGNCPGDGIWTYNGPPKEGDGGHSMLIVGYDRRDPDKPYFIVKNSWGPSGTPEARGFTYIAYDYLQYGATAGYITGVTDKAWPELRFVGRWELSFDGWKGLLDITHMPGVIQDVLKQGGNNTTDRRMGIFYADNDPTKAYRVNGAVSGNRIDFYIDSDNTNPGWDKRGGRHFTYYLAGDVNLMAGSHRDPDGKVWGGFARRLKSDAAFPTGPQQIPVGDLPELTPFRPAGGLPDEVTPEAYLGTWKVILGTIPGGFTLTQRADNFVPGNLKADYAGLRGTGVVALVNQKDPAQFSFLVFAPTGQITYRFTGRLLSWDRGIVAGTLQPESGVRASPSFGAILVRGS